MVPLSDLEPSDYGNVDATSRPREGTIVPSEAKKNMYMSLHIRSLCVSLHACEYVHC